MNELQIFENTEFGEVRVVEHEGQPWFVAKDVLKALGYAEDYNPSRALQAVPEEWKGVQPIHTPGGMQEMLTLSESGLYFFLARSDKPKALPFQKWLAEDVVPSIRKTGGYMLAKADGTPESIMARAVLVAKETIERLKNRTAELEDDVQRMKPKELFADSVSASESSILVGQLAALLKQNGVNIVQNRLFERLRNDGFLIKFGERRNCPTQRALEMGLFELKERTVNNPDGSVRITLTTKVTGKGQVYFVNRYIGENRKASVLIAC